MEVSWPGNGGKANPLPPGAGGACALGCASYPGNEGSGPLPGGAGGALTALTYCCDGGGYTGPLPGGLGGALPTLACGGIYSTGG